MCKHNSAPRPKKINIEIQYQNIFNWHREQIKKETEEFDKAHAAYLEEYAAYEKACRGEDLQETCSDELQGDNPRETYNI